MALDALLARLEGRAVTPITADVTPDVAPKPAPIKACTSVTAENDDAAGIATGEPLSDPASEVRRQRVLEILAAHPGARYAVVTDTKAQPEVVILTLAIRGRATCELRISREKYDGLLLLDLVERHSGTVH